MNKNISVIVDSDFWLAFYLAKDANSEKAGSIFEKLQNDNFTLITTTAVVGEVATVLSHRGSAGSVQKFLDWVYESGLQVIHISEEVHQQGIKLLMQSNKRGASYVDCTNVALMELYDFEYICAFDKVYHQQYGLHNVCYNIPT